MNFWHIQLHPNDNKLFDIDIIKKILNEKKIIGLGENEKKSDFQNKMSLGDIVAVKNGNKPIALVRVLEKSYYENNTNEKLDWFCYRRKIEILDIYKNEYNFTIPQARGTLSICDNLGTKTSKIIINWYKKITMENLMNSIKLTGERKNQIKALWDNFKATYTEKDKKVIADEIEELSKQWNKYKEKIKEKTLTLDDYTNILDNSMAQMPGGYLCNFLERTTRIILGSSKPGTAINFGVKLNDDNKTYTIGKEKPKEIKEVAQKYYDEKIKPLITDIMSKSDIKDKISIAEESNYAAKQIIRKLIVLDHLNDFIYIYSDDIIDKLFDEFSDDDETYNLGKNQKLSIILKEILKLENDDITERVILSRFLWMYSNTKGIADENTPNVILYGPPGTGKTYAVKNSLDFVCQGDKSLYEFVQFHPSFTYEDFIEGIKPKGVTKDGNIRFELVDGIFKRFCKRAKKHPEKDYYFVVDEINRANLSSVFGETLLCLEKDYRHKIKSKNNSNLIKTQYSALIEEMIKEDSEKNKELAYEYIDGNAYFGVPENVFFIGMMNDVDKSIDTFDLALRRRFKWIRKDCNYDVVEQETKFKYRDEFINILKYVNSCKKLNDYISEELGLGKSYEFGHSFFMKISGISKRKEITQNNIKELFSLHLRPTLKEYLRAMYPEKELDKQLNIALDKFKQNIK